MVHYMTNSKWVDLCIIVSRLVNPVSHGQGVSNTTLLHIT